MTGPTRRTLAAMVAITGVGIAAANANVIALANASDQNDPLPSWREGANRSAILAFVAATTTPGSPDFVPEAERVASFDQDGTLWVEQPAYTQFVYMLDQVAALVRRRPELAGEAPFDVILSGDLDLISQLTGEDFLRIATATEAGLTIEGYRENVAKWLAHARHPRWKRPYTELLYLPMLELMAYLRAHGYRTYIITGGGQQFVRVYANRAYGEPPQNVIGTSSATRFRFDADGKAWLEITPELLINDNGPGKARDMEMFIGQRAQFACGNSDGDREMLEYVTSAPGRRLGALVMHDDAQREYAYGPAQGLPPSKVGTFPQNLYDEARARGWLVISMKDDWKRIFKFEE